MHAHIFKAAAAAVLVSVLAACTPFGLMASAGASVGVASSQEGGLRAAVSDSAIQLQISDLWFKRDLKLFRDLSLTVKEGRVLVTGTVDNPNTRVEAVRLAWQADGVRQVINEIQVGKGEGFGGAVSDRWITSAIKARIVLDKHVQSINYNIDTAGGIVYLMGVAQDQDELDRVITYARNTRGVKNVISYMRFRYQNPKDAGPPARR